MKNQLILLFLLLIGSNSFAYQLEESTEDTTELRAALPVIHQSDTLFFLSSNGTYKTAEERVEAISNGITSVLEKALIDFNSFETFRDGDRIRIVYEGDAVFSIYPEDTVGSGLNQQELADLVIESIEDHATTNLGIDRITQTAKRIGLLLALILSFFLVIRLLNAGISRGNTWIYKQVQKRIKGITNPRNRFFTMARLADFIRIVLRFIKWVIILILVYALLPIGFSIFPSTEEIGLKLIGYVIDPVKAFGDALISYIPEFIAIIVIILIARAIIRLIRYFAREIEAGRFQIDGFYPEWADPTYNLLRVLVIIFTFVAVFPLIPGSGSDVFKGVSVFFGLLISLGSSSAIGNIIAGLVITYMRPFQVGDRVRIGDATGDVVEKTLLVTRLRTIKNEDVTIPNSSILTGNTFNYSANAKERGLILNSSVTIGYDIPWRKVHDMLLEAADRTHELLKEPKPFVLQTALDDFYVSYQINCYTEKAEISARIYSELHGHIQDVFAENNVEILSPHYRAERDGSDATIPPTSEKE